MISNQILSRAAGLFAIAATLCTLPVTGFAGSGSKDAPPVQEKASGLSGVELWTIHCNRCHTYRGPNEFTAAHWQNILLHMRVRANLPAAQAREILKFLQQGAGK